jgi:hypothetical protein
MTVKSTMKSAATILKENFVATRVCFHWWGQSRRVEKGTKTQMATAVQAQSDSITAGKRIYSNELECIAQINSLKCTIKDWWEAQTNPYGENGVRLLPKEKLEDFNATMKKFQQELGELGCAVQMQRDKIMEDAKARLGQAFAQGNYPIDLAGEYGLEWEFPNLEPSGELPQQVYQQQQAFLQAKMAEAVKLTEQALLQEFSNLVENLHEKLTPSPDGKKKQLRDSAVTNLQEFFDKFKKLNVGSSEQLEALVSEAQELLHSMTPQEIRAHDGIKKEIAEGLSKVSNALTPLVVNKPRRNIITPHKNGASNGEVKKEEVVTV